MKVIIENSLLSFSLVVIAALTLFTLEKKFPLRHPSQKLIPRLTVNLLMASLTFIVAITIVRSVSMKSISWNAENSFGLLNLFEASPWIKLIIGFLLLDLTFYYWHRINHRFSVLWRFHNTHHIDPDLDVSTGFRFHYGEVGYSSIFRMTQILIIGPDAFIFLSYEFIFQLATLFHHSNIRLPKKVDDFINIFIVTPRMHGIHHSNYQSETNSNYSVVFSFWDRCHNTFNRNIPQEKIQIGIPGYSSKQDNSLWALLKAPFKIQKDYWKGRYRRESVK